MTPEQSTPLGLGERTRMVQRLLGRTLQAARAQTGLSQVRFAGLKDLDPGLIYRLELGTGWTLRNLILIADALDTEPVALLASALKK